MTEDYFTLLPNRIVLNTEEEPSIVNQIGDDKVILILDYLCGNLNKKGITSFSIERIVKYLGQKPNNNKGRINDKIKNIIKQMKEIKIINDIDPIEFTAKEYVSCMLNSIEKNSKGDNVKFFKLHKHEIDKILSIKDIDNMNLLKLYCYLKAMIYKRTDGRDIVIYGGKASSCYPSYEQIHKDIGISDMKIKQYVDMLVEINLIRYNNCGLYYHKNNPKIIIEGRNSYVLYTEGETWEIELKESLKLGRKLMEEKGYVFVNNKKEKVIRKQSRVANGKKGYLKKQLNNGEISEEEYQKEIEKMVFS